MLFCSVVVGVEIDDRGDWNSKGDGHFAEEVQIQIPAKVIILSRQVAKVGR